VRSKNVKKKKKKKKNNDNKNVKIMKNKETWGKMCFNKYILFDN
jgi:hypothetical protein